MPAIAVIYRILGYSHNLMCITPKSRAWEDGAEVTPPNKVAAHFVNNHLLLSLLFILLSLELLHLSKQKWLRKLLTGKPKSNSNPKFLVYRPKSEKDCLCCQAALAQGKSLQSECPHTPPIAWDQLKGKGGKRKSNFRGSYLVHPLDIRWPICQVAALLKGTAALKQIIMLVSSYLNHR